MNKKGLLVHLHVFYHDQVDYFIEKLKNINGIDWDLIVTYSSFNPVTTKKLQEFKPSVRFLKTENVGYDIWPFIKAIKSLDLRNYDYLMKLHTKRKIDGYKKINHIKMGGYDWRNHMVNSLLASPTRFNKVLKILKKRKEIGMLSSLETFSYNGWDIYEKKLKDEMKKFNLKLFKGRTCLGTMFLARSEIFQPLVEAEWLAPSYFNDHEVSSGSNFSISHIYERLLSLLPISFGLKHKGVSSDPVNSFKLNLNSKIKGPVEWFFCIFRKGENHRKALRICGLEFYIGKPRQINFASKEDS